MPLATSLVCSAVADNWGRQWGSSSPLIDMDCCSRYQSAIGRCGRAQRCEKVQELIGHKAPSRVKIPVALPATSRPLFLLT